MRWDQGQTDSSFNCFNFFHVSSLKFPTYPGIISTTTPLFCCSFCLEWFNFAFVTACLPQGLNLSPSISLRINVLCHRRGIEGKRLFGKVPSLPFLMCQRSYFNYFREEKNVPYTYSKTQKTAPDSKEIYLQVVLPLFLPSNSLFELLQPRGSFSTRTLI